MSFKDQLTPGEPFNIDNNDVTNSQGNKVTEEEIRVNTINVTVASLDECGCVPIPVCPTGPMGPMGDTGPTGAPGDTGPGISFVYLATDQSIANNQFLGLGDASASFIRNTFVVPQNAMITGLVFNIRDNCLSTGSTATAEIFRSINCGVTSTPTGIIARVTGLTPPRCASVSAVFPVNQCDLLSVRVTTGGGVLSSGAAATILFSTP